MSNKYEGYKETLSKKSQNKNKENQNDKNTSFCRWFCR